MTTKQTINLFYSELADFYPKTEIQSFVHLVFEHKLHFSSIDLHLKSDYEIPEGNLDFFHDAIIRLKKMEPIQYILGETEFYGLKFLVNKNVLIPRPETEELVDFILKNEYLTTQNNILDIGTGSGCIPISLAKNTMANVFAVDISEKALIAAMHNAELNRVEVEFIQQNILETDEIIFEGNFLKFDLIVSNPPYVRESEKLLMKSNVLDFEPNLALFVGDEKPLIFYAAIAKFAQKSLNENGKIYLEINEFLADETVDLFVKMEFKSVKKIKDLSGKDRFIVVIK
ncbi:MAG: peptide chain release factor N(5)-glutamine methyltransferase [Bacteroidales bacterium]|nr:peptide chain release factor N(5)-glutamine methyltransferase [Bacteroidales bacterium]